MTYDTINDAVTMQGGAKGVLGRIDKYELVGELGEGGFGAVYLARDTVAKTDVAIKGLPPEVKHNNAELEGIRANFALVKRLRHPNIVAVTDLHQALAVSYASKEVEAKLRVFSRDTMVVMDYAPGVTLAKWRRQFPDGKVPLDKAIAVAGQVASALDYAHEQKVLHRDVKPANVIVETSADGSQTARVLDFGLAAEIRSSMGRLSREIRDTSGTRPYMAPEQWLGHRQGPATDQYALAVIFYELVAGEVPFASVFDCGDPMVMRLAVTTDVPDILPDLPKGVRNALAKALAKKPEDRFASCGDFVAALEGRIAVAEIQKTAAEKQHVGLPKVLIAFALAVGFCVAGFFVWTKVDDFLKARRAEEELRRQTERKRISAEGNRRESEILRDCSVQEGWNSWPHFELKAKMLDEYFRMGVAALERGDYVSAEEFFSKVKQNWEWLSSNKTDRAEAATSELRVKETLQKTVAKVDASLYTPNKWIVLTNDIESARHFFDAGAFQESAKRFIAIADSIPKMENEALRIKTESDTQKAIAAYKQDKLEECWNFVQTADQDNKEVQVIIGACFEYGRGTDRNLAKALEWYRKAVASGDKSAAQSVERVVTIQAVEAFKAEDWQTALQFSRAADRSNGELQFYLGVCEEKGGGGKRNLSEAFKWYANAVSNGYKIAKTAQLRVGTELALQAFREERWKDGFEMSKYADSNNGEFLFYIGQCYENGRGGLLMDIDEARKWYLKSKEKNYAQAKEAVERASGKLEAMEEERREDRFQKVLVQNNIDIAKRFPADRVIKVSADMDLWQAISRCPNGGTLMLEEGTYKINNANGREEIVDKDIRIVGKHPEKTFIFGDITSMASNMVDRVLWVENVSFNGYDKRVRAEKECSLVICKCKFRNGSKVSVGKGAVLIMTRSSISGAEWAITSDAVAIVMDTQIYGDKHAVIAFEGTRTYLENVVMDGSSEGCVYVPYKNSKTYIRNCTIKNVHSSIGVLLGNNGNATIDGLLISNCKGGISGSNYEGSKSYCEYHNVQFENCEKELSEEGVFVRRDEPINF